MTDEQFDIIKEFVDEESEKGNIEDLRKIIEYINQRLKSKINETSKKEYITLSDNNFLTLFDILKEPFIEFYENNMPDSNNMKPLYNAFYLENISKGNLIINREDLKVYHTLGFDCSKILSYVGANRESIDEYENILNKYGLTFWTKFTDFQLLELKQKQKIKEKN